MAHEMAMQRYNTPPFISPKELCFSVLPRRLAMVEQKLFVKKSKHDICDQTA
jgi:hypothetical protein